MTFNDLITKKNYSVYKLSKDSGVPTSTIFDIVSGKSTILDCSGRVLLNISKCLNVSIEVLLSLDQEIYNPVFEKNIPAILKNSLDVYKRKRRTKDSLLDCYYDELNSTINVCEVEHLIPKEQADYLRKKYLR